MKLKNSQVIYAELCRIEKVIKELHKQLHTIEDEDTRKICAMSLNEHMIRKSTLEWVFK